MTLWASIVGEIHVLLAALILFVLLPSWALSGRIETHLRASVLAVGVAFWVTVVTMLAYVSSVRYSLLFVVGFVGLVVSVRLIPKASVADAAGHEVDSLTVWDTFERPLAALQRWSHQLKDTAIHLWTRFSRLYGPWGVMLTIGALLWALIYGSWPWLHQVGPGAPEGYSDLLRIASLTSNTGVYAGGSAPTGVPALGAALATAFFLPPVNVLRFLYPLADMFTVLASGVLAHQLTRSGRASALVMFLVSVSSLAHLGYPVNFESPLSMHWADILILLAWAEALAWSQSRALAHALFSALSLLAASLTSPPEAAVGLGVAIILTIGEGWVVIGWGAVASLLGVLPLGIGIAAGHALSPDGWLKAGFSSLPAIWLSPKNSAYWLCWIGIALLLFNTRRSMDSHRRRFVWATGLVALAAAGLGWNPTAASLMLWSGILGLMVLIAGVDMLLVAAAGQMRYPNAIDWAIVGVAAIGALIPSRGPQLQQYEPPQAAAATLRIEQTFPPYEWTVVSPVDQYSEVLGQGWHEELALFDQTYSLAQARNPQFHLRDTKDPIKTPNVFIYVEPHLFPSGIQVTRSDLSIPIANGSGAYQGRSMQGVEARAYYWALAYHRSHPKTSQIYVRTRDLMVLWIRQ